MRSGFELSNMNTKVPDGLDSTGKPIRVLIIDDSKFVVKQLTQILVSESYEVCGSANDGEEGVNLCKELDPDLITLDITMPKMDGITALDKIIEFNKNQKVIMVSALGKEDVVKRALLKGAKNFIIKPLDRKKVLERVYKVAHK